jgi:hypothetical protein
MRFSKSFVECDRCKKVFEEKTRETPIVMWMKFQSYNGKRPFGEGNKDYHLCIDCEREFIDWFCCADWVKKA